MIMRKNKPSSKSYDVGYGRPPEKSRFKRGQSGNPSGTKRTPPSATADLRAVLERALNEKVTVRRGDRDETMTKAAAGITELVNQFAKGDRHARRHLTAFAETVGYDLTAGQGRAIANALAAAFTAEDEDIIADFLRRQGVQPEHRGDDLDEALNENDLEKSVNKATEEESS
jgi:uncharacterized protein DUF5681